MISYEDYVVELREWVEAYGAPYAIKHMPYVYDILDYFEEGISAQEVAMNWIAHVRDVQGY